ncbi:hypothetical protein P3342_003764 [Pyrenophora teres f. teres]|uniref:Ubiquitin-like protease family profile domain-containing protein n=1 Tax=Pyrenophora teres f. teres TaxID=97479 RepID=A0A6S6VS22_9PLEO|nr:hypothetical protein PTNB29_00968 [Pyrenophora teres f. teres]KAK1915949.1 hypothetical protein P3342_003764 [Pyrenophora teres f. teres]CAE7013355.1 hypothetical protein PTTW11_02492 [Pyrenophora teres f. teres]
MNHPQLNVAQDWPRIFPLVSPTFRDANGETYKLRYETRIPPVVVNDRWNGLTTRSFARRFVTTTERDNVVGKTWNDAKRGIRQGYPDVMLDRRWSVHSYTCSPDLSKWNTQSINDYLEQDDLYRRSYTLKTNPNLDEIIYESENTSLTVSAFLNICKSGTPGWFTDTMVDTSFDVLSRVTRCEENAVSLLSVSMASQLYRNGRRIMARKETEYYDDHLKGKIMKKSFILIPISDGYMQAYRFGSAQEEWGVNAMPEAPVAGSHWTLLAVDCRDTRNLTCHYFDSMKSNSPEKSPNCKVAKSIVKALRAFGSLEKPSPFHIVQNAPHQKGRENRSQVRDGVSACGPFIWDMSRQICQYLADCYEDNASEIDISVPQGFCQRRQWDSMETRESIRRLIMHENRTRVRLNGRSQWMDDHVKGLPGWNSWLMKEGKPPHYLWDPMTSEVSKSESESGQDHMDLS